MGYEPRHPGTDGNVWAPDCHILDGDFYVRAPPNAA